MSLPVFWMTLPRAAFCSELALISALLASAILSTTALRSAVPVAPDTVFEMAPLAAFWS